MNFCRTLLLIMLLFAGPGLLAQEQAENIDPLESINRPLFAFNDGLDRFVVRPLAIGYDFILPDFAQRGMGNFFANLYDANAVVNSLLQGRLEGTAQSTGRLVTDLRPPAMIRPACVAIEQPSWWASNFRRRQTLSRFAHVWL